MDTKNKEWTVAHAFGMDVIHIEAAIEYDIWVWATTNELKDVEEF